MQSILLLRSADLKLCDMAIEMLIARFPEAKIHLLVQKSVEEYFKLNHPNIELVQYPYRDFNMASLASSLNHIPSVDLALSLYKNNGEDYLEVDSFLQARINAKEYGHITGSMQLEYETISPWRQKAKALESTLRLYGCSPLAMARSALFTKRHCPDTSRVVLSRNSRILVDPGGCFEMAPGAICRVGYLPPEWNHVRAAGDAVIRVQPRGRLIIDGSCNLFSGVRINVFPGGTLRIGEGSYIAFDSKIYCGNSIEIGSNCAVSWDVEIMDTLFHRLELENQDAELDGIVIKDHVWIGAGARVMKAVQLGNNVVVGSDSVVTKSFPDNTLVAGNPAKPIGAKKTEFRV
jgi:acetyltransferase-like isoleucine patch superfamily enzyme